MQWRYADCVRFLVQCRIFRCTQWPYACFRLVSSITSCLHRVNFSDSIFTNYVLQYFPLTAVIGNVKVPGNPERTMYLDFGTANLYYFLSKGERGPLYTIPKKTYLRRTDFLGLMGMTVSQPQYSISSSFNTFPIPMNESYLNVKVPLTNIEQSQIL